MLSLSLLFFPRLALIRPPRLDPIKWPEEEKRERGEEKEESDEMIARARGSSFCVNIKKIHSVSFFTSKGLPRLHVFEIGSSGWMLGFSLTSLAMACVFVLESAF